MLHSYTIVASRSYDLPRGVCHISNCALSQCIFAVPLHRSNVGLYASFGPSTSTPCNPVFPWPTFVLWTYVTVLMWARQKQIITEERVCLRFHEFEFVSQLEHEHSRKRK